MISTFKHYRHFIIHPTTDEVDRINEFTFKHYSKDWVLKRGFLPVLRFISDREFGIKIYYNGNKIQERRMMEEYCALYFVEKIDLLKHCNSCNAIRIPLSKWVKSEDVKDCKSSSELEFLFLRDFTDDTYVGCNDHGGGLTMYLSHLRRYFSHWHKLVNNDILTPDYVSKVEKEEEIIKKEIKIRSYLKTGGPQPTSLDAEKVNYFFKGNIAKIWAMNDGFLPTYTGYDNRIITFDLLTDPRCTGLYWISLCNKIAVQYKKHIELLTDATHFKVNHFIANDIIGFNISADDEDKLKEYNDRIHQTYATLPSKAEMIHFGKIV